MSAAEVARLPGSAGGLSGAPEIVFNRSTVPMGRNWDDMRARHFKNLMTVVVGRVHSISVKMGR